MCFVYASLFLFRHFFFCLHFSSNAFHYRMHHLVYVLGPISWALIRVANTFYDSRLDVIHPYTYVWQDGAEIWYRTFAVDMVDNSIQ